MKRRVCAQSRLLSFLPLSSKFPLDCNNSTSYSIVVNRDRYETVTRFALLLPASASEAMGEATFTSEASGPSHVRAVRLEEIKVARKNLRGTEAARFDALLFLRGALESGDQLALDRALERMEKFYRLRQSETPMDPDLGHQFGALFAQKTGLSPLEAGKYIFGLRPGPKAAGNPRRLFSYEVSQAVGTPFHTEVVLWWMGGAFRPAIFCPDVKIALYIHTFFLAPVGGLGFRVCPYDGEQFFQDRPNQEYCCVAHREAHRVARFRDNKKREAVKQRKDGKNHGAQETR